MDLTLEPEDYCRQLESYLCRKNEGHLIRVVGPAFEQVCGWARRGVPLGVAQRGIDRYFERYYAKGPRRRPVRIEFCEADVLDTFDEWRRALGVPLAAAGQGAAGQGAGGHGVGNAASTPAGSGDPGGDAGARNKGTLPAHLERVIARLTAARAGEARALDAELDAIVRELDGMRAAAKGLRGQAREDCLLRLGALDVRLIDAARQLADEAATAELEREADLELAPFRDRMLAAAYARSRRACIDRLLRERHRLPVISFE